MGFVYSFFLWSCYFKWFNWFDRFPSYCLVDEFVGFLFID